MTSQSKTVRLLLTTLLASSILALPAGAQAPASTGASATAPAASAPFRFREDRSGARADRYYSIVWGVDSLNAKAVESGEIIRFTYRVLDPEKAKMLNDKKFEPSLIDPDAGVKLVVPSLEQVGMLRQSSTPIAGKAYWMAFSNSGRRVRPGDRVTVVIGQFQAAGLIVQ